MKIFKNPAVVFVMFLFFVIALSCGKEEEGRKVDLDKRTSDVSQLVKITDMKKSLTFCFDSRLDPLEEIKIYGFFVSYSNSVVKLKNLNFRKIKHCNINKIFFE